MDISEIYEKELNIDEVQYDSFVFKAQKFIVIKNELIGLDKKTLENDKNAKNGKSMKRLILGVVGYVDDKPILMQPSIKEYEEAKNYYINLKRAFLEG